jgi:hypothetical protein
MKISLNLRNFTVAAFLAASIAAHATDDSTNSLTLTQKNYLPWDKGSVKLGGFVAAFDDRIAFGTGSGAGVAFNPEKLLGLDTTLTVFRIEAMFRPGESLRNQLDFSYASYHRSGEAILSADLNIGGTTYPVGADIETTFNFDIIRGTYSYAVLQDERMRIALGLGVYAVPLKYGLTITTTGGQTAVNGANTTLPLPALALQSEFQLIPKLYLDASMNAMYLEISNFKGSLLDVNIGLEYQLWKHFGLGLAYNAMAMNVEGDSIHSSYPGANFTGSVNVGFSGLMLYGKFSF